MGDTIRLDLADCEKPYLEEALRVATCTASSRLAVPMPSIV